MKYYCKYEKHIFQLFSAHKETENNFHNSNNCNRNRSQIEENPSGRSSSENQDILSSTSTQVIKETSTTSKYSLESAYHSSQNSSNFESQFDQEVKKCESDFDPLELTSLQCSTGCECESVNSLTGSSAKMSNMEQRASSLQQRLQARRDMFMKDGSAGTPGGVSSNSSGTPTYGSRIGKTKIEFIQYMTFRALL